MLGRFSELDLVVYNHVSRRNHPRLFTPATWPRPTYRASHRLFALLWNLEDASNHMFPRPAPQNPGFILCFPSNADEIFMLERHSHVIRVGQLWKDLGIVDFWWWGLRGGGSQIVSDICRKPPSLAPPRCLPNGLCSPGYVPWRKSALTLTTLKRDSPYRLQCRAGAKLIPSIKWLDCLKPPVLQYFSSHIPLTFTRDHAPDQRPPMAMLADFWLCCQLTPRSAQRSNAFMMPMAGHWLIHMNCSMLFPHKGKEWQSTSI